MTYYIINYINQYNPFKKSITRYIDTFNISYGSIQINITMTYEATRQCRCIF